MLNIRGEKIFTQTELLENLIEFLNRCVGDEDRETVVGIIYPYVAAMIGETEHYVQGYLKKALRLER
jgi:hypothetical protein